MLIMLLLIGTFSFNFLIFISTMAVGLFQSDARASVFSPPSWRSGTYQER